MTPRAWAFWRLPIGALGLCSVRGWRVGWALHAVVMATVGSAAPAHALSVRVATLNVFDLPELLFPVQSAERMRQIPDALARAMPLASLDAIVLTEAYVPSDREAVAAKLASRGFVHRADLTRQRFWDHFRLPGVMLLSRWPLSDVRSMGFTGACAGADCFAVKGAVAATLTKSDQGRPHRLHLIGTHFYLGGSQQHVEARRRQALALASWISSRPMAPDEPVMVAGDFNASWLGDGPALADLLHAAPATRDGPLDYTFVGTAHPLGGSPWQRHAKRCQRIRAGAEPSKEQGRKWVDYVWALPPGPRPTSSHWRAYALTGAPYALGTDGAGPCWTDALSDHHAVLGEFTFADGRPEERS